MEALPSRDAALKEDCKDSRGNEPPSGPSDLPSAFSKFWTVFAFFLWGLAFCSFLLLFLLNYYEAKTFGDISWYYQLLAVILAPLCLLVPLLLPWKSRMPYRLLGALGTLSFALDQLSKCLAVCYLKGEASIPVIGNFLFFTYVENRGAAFGLMQGYTTWFIVMAVVTVGIIAVYFRLTGEDEHLVQVALVLILAGALGNLVDRVLLGYVVDFLDLHYQDVFKWPVFNVADTVIDIGVALIILDLLRDLFFGVEAGDSDVSRSS